MDKAAELRARNNALETKRKQREENADLGEEGRLLRDIAVGRTKSGVDSPRAETPMATDFPFAALSARLAKQREQTPSGPQQRITQLFEEGVRLAAAMSGANVSEIDAKPMRVASPRFLSVVPDNNTVRLRARSRASPPCHTPKIFSSSISYHLRYSACTVKEPVSRSFSVFQVCCASSQTKISKLGSTSSSRVPASTIRFIISKK